MKRLAATRREVLAGGAAAALALSARPALAAFPERPVRWVVPYAAGGGTDVIARLVANAMGPVLRQQVVIENKPGASTNLGADSVAKAPADGYTLLTADNGTLVNNKGLFAKLPYDPDTDLAPIGLLARFNLLLTVSKTSTVTDAKAFVAKAKAAPGSINYGSPGVGSPHHLAMARLARDTGMSLTHVPYRGLGPLVTDLLAGTVESGIVDYAAGGEMMRTGQIRPLAVCSAKRLPGLPDVPTIQEALGLPGFEAYAWQGLVTTAKTPDEAMKTLITAHAAAMKDETVLKRMGELGVEPLPGGPADLTTLVKAERAVWLPLIKELGLTLN
jgi:tripartite-type tricarboxylate transporter receptor subunit TctC